MKRAYTLLADDNLAIASELERERQFAAHLIYGCLTNHQIVFSDNQIVNARNLRALIDRNGTVRDLVKDRLFAFAVREVGEGENRPSTSSEPGTRLRGVAEAFVSEGKLRSEVLAFSNERTLDYVENHAELLPWTYKAVRDGFTKRCEQAFVSERSQEVFGPTLFDVIIEMIAEEKERSATVDAGLGRHFLQVRLPDALNKRGYILTPEQAQHLRDCSEGPYLSNLPRLLKLDPIYEDQHRSAFDLMRVAPVSMLSDTGAPRSQRVRLRSDFFVEGLLRFTPDDIHAIRETEGFKRFITLTQSANVSEGSVDDLAVAFEVLSLEIEDRIIGRFPELGLHTSEPAPRELRVKWARIKNTAGVSFELVNMTLSSFGLPAIPGLGQDLVLTEVRKSIIGTEEALASQEAARRRISLRRISDYLRGHSRDEKIGADHDVDIGSKNALESYDETIVAAIR